MSRRLGESTDKEVEDQAEQDGYAAGRYAGDGRIVRDMRDKHKRKNMPEQSIDKGFKEAIKAAKDD